MAWTDLIFVGSQMLTSVEMAQVQSNFSALAGQEAGSPWVTFENSGTHGDVSSFNHFHAASGFSGPEVSSFGSVHAASGFAGPQVNSFGTVHAGSGFVAPAVSSLNRVVTQHGYAISSADGGNFKDTEIVLVTASAAVLGNRVDIQGALYDVAAAANKGGALALRIGSAGGTLISSHFIGMFASLGVVHVIFDSYVPNSGPFNVVMTAKNTTDGSSVTYAQAMLRVLELPQ